MKKKVALTCSKCGRHRSGPAHEFIVSTVHDLEESGERRAVVFGDGERWETWESWTWNGYQDIISRGAICPACLEESKAEFRRVAAEIDASIRRMLEADRRRRS